MPFGNGSVRNVLAAGGLKLLIETDGLQMARSLLNKYSDGNASRLMKSLASTHPGDGPDLYEIYQKETRAQLEGN
jgi:hypothetical protein